VPITKHIASGCRGENRLAEAALDEGSHSLPRPCVGPESHLPEDFHALLALNPLRAFAVALPVALLYNRFPSWEAPGAIILMATMVVLGSFKSRLERWQGPSDVSPGIIHVDIAFPGRDGFPSHDSH
jgi:hypothetical protein